MTKDISIEEYRANFTGDDAPEYLLIDVREPDEYEQGHLPGAILMPMSEFQMRMDELDEDATIVLVCATGNRSSRVGDFMTAQGYSDVYNLLDGTMGWMMRGLPVER